MHSCPRWNTSILLVCSAVVAVGCGAPTNSGDGPDSGSPSADSGTPAFDSGTPGTDAGRPPDTFDGGVRFAAAKQTAETSALCKAIGSFYWEVGDASGALGSGSVLGSTPSSKTYTADTSMPIASASKWFYSSYWVERTQGLLSPGDIKFLTFWSGYTNFTQCGQSITVADCLSGTSGTLDPVTENKFDYGGGHMQKHAELNGLGALTNSTLATEILSKVGPEIDLSYSSPQPAGGGKASASGYAKLLRKIVAGELAEPRQVRSDFPAPLWKVLQQALASRPESRPASAAQLARALDGVAGVTPAQGRALLGSAMSRLFPDEMGAESSDIAELRRLSRPAEEATVQGHVVSRVTPERGSPRPRVSTLGWVVGLTLLGGGAAAVFANRPAPPTSPPRAAASSFAEPRTAVEIGVQVSPASLPGLRVSIDGVEVAPQTLHRVVSRATGPLVVKVTAPGYGSVELPVVPDRDRTLMVTLAPVPPAVRASDVEPSRSASPRVPAPAKSGVIRRYPF